MIVGHYLGVGPTNRILRIITTRDHLGNRHYKNTLQPWNLPRITYTKPLLLWTIWSQKAASDNQTEPSPPAA
jgi:hypothetical protein